MQQPNHNVVVLAEMSEAEAGSQNEDSSSSSAGSVHSDSAGTVEGSECSTVASVSMEEIICGIECALLAEWARRNSPAYTTPEEREGYVEMFLDAARIFDEVVAQATADSSMLDLFDINEEQEEQEAQEEGSDEEAAPA